MEIAILPEIIFIPIVALILLIFNLVSVVLGGVLFFMGVLSFIIGFGSVMRLYWL